MYISLVIYDAHNPDTVLLSSSGLPLLTLVDSQLSGKSLLSGIEVGWPKFPSF